MLSVPFAMVALSTLGGGPKVHAALDILMSTPNVADILAIKRSDRIRLHTDLSVVERQMRKLQPYPNETIRLALKQIDDWANRQDHEQVPQVREYLPRIGGEDDSVYNQRVWVRFAQDKLEGVFVTRYLFDLPETAPLVSANDYGTMTSDYMTMTSIKDHRFRPLTPFIRHSDGSTELVIQNLSDFVGDSGYNGAVQFAEYAKLFPRRKKWWN